MIGTLNMTLLLGCSRSTKTLFKLSMMSNKTALENQQMLIISADSLLTQCMTVPPAGHVGYDAVAQPDTQPGHISQELILRGSFVDTGA